MKNILVYLLLYPLATPAHIIHAQTLLPLPSSHRCTWESVAFPRDLYRLKLDSTADICARIVQNTGIETTFEVVPSNVAATAAVVDSSGKRWILYSRKRFMTEIDPAWRVAALAHMIGHHANGHPLDSICRDVQEVEADEFAGFALYRMGISRAQVQAFAQQRPAIGGLDSVERRAALFRGYNRGEASILIAPNSAFNDDGSGQALPGVPEFPFPPPEASASYSLEEYFSNIKTIGEVDTRLVQALKSSGYNERRYFYIKGGFVMVTRMEQMNEQGYSLSTNRWNPKSVREEAFSLANYFKSLFVSQPGYFRIFAFVATNEPLRTKSDLRVNRQTAEAWLNEGCFKLPPAIAKIPIGPSASIAALVYEFRVPEATMKPQFSQPSSLSGAEHLLRSNIANGLK